MHGNLRWPLLVALAGLLLTTELQGKVESDEVKALRQKAEAGDVQSQTWIGLMYYSGAGVPKNLEEAAKWIKKSADSGSAEAQYKLSQMYDKGEGLPKSESDQLKWLLKAAESGHAKAQFEYGLRLAFYFGPTDPSRDKKGIVWYKKSADQGYALAMVALAECFYYGRGVSESNEEAEKLFRKAAGQDYKDAKIKLGRMFIRQEAEPRDSVERATFERMAREASPKVLEIDDEGEIWVTDFDGLRRRCESDETGTVLVPEIVQLKDTYLESEGFRANSKLNFCIQLYVQPWDRIVRDSTLKLNPLFYYYKWSLIGRFKSWSLSPVDEPHGFLKGESSPWSPGVIKEDIVYPLNINSQYQIAAKLHLASLNSPGATRAPYIRIPEIEFRWYKRAAEFGHPEAQYDLASLYDRGIGVKKNPSLAAKWYLKSAELGNADAQCQVGYLYLLGRGLPRDEIEAYAYLNMASATIESVREDVIKLERQMPPSARYAGQQRTRQLVKEVEDKKESMIRQSKESQKARDKKGA